MCLRASSGQSDPNVNIALLVQPRDALTSFIKCLCCCRCTNLEEPSELKLKLKACSGCGVAHFCGLACQRAAWPAHRAACKALRSSAA